MDQKTIEPLDTGQRIRRQGRKRFLRKWMKRVLRNRLLLMVVLWMAKVIVQLARLIGAFIDGS